jgi:GNAT superfamily N-acetyltransferase
MPLGRNVERQVEFQWDDTKMNIEIVDLTEKNLVDAPEWPSHPFSCKYCIYWQYPDNFVDPPSDHKRKMLARKLSWLQSVAREFGECGKLLYADGRSVGYAQYAPPRHLPNSADYDSGPPSADAVLLSCLFISQEQYRGVGLGGQFLHSITDELKERGVTAIETFGRKGNPDNPSGPAEFYLANGFRVHRDEKDFPLMRLDL